MKNPIVECIQYLEMVSCNHLSKIIFIYTNVIQISVIFVEINFIEDSFPLFWEDSKTGKSNIQRKQDKLFVKKKT